MHRHPRFIRSVLALGLAAGLAMLPMGCTEAGSAIATAETAKAALKASKVAAEVIQQVPQAIREIAEAAVTSSHPNWGQPEKIVITDQLYLFIYPTTAAQRRANNGTPNMLVILRNASTEPMKSS